MFKKMIYSQNTETQVLDTVTIVVVNLILPVYFWVPPFSQGEAFNACNWKRKVLPFRY